MPRKIVKTIPDSSQPLHAALTPEVREQQMIGLAMDLVEERLRNGTASSQETTHFLKLASSKERLEREKLEVEKKLLEAKILSLESSQHSEELYANAIAAMRSYSGSGSEDIETEEY